MDQIGYVGGGAVKSVVIVYISIQVLASLFNGCEKCLVPRKFFRSTQCQCRSTQRPGLKSAGSLRSEEIGVVFLGYRIRRGRGPGVTSLVHAWLNVRCVRIRRVNIAIKGMIDSL